MKQVRYLLPTNGPHQEILFWFIVASDKGLTEISRIDTVDVPSAEGVETISCAPKEEGGVLFFLEDLSRRFTPECVRRIIRQIADNALSPLRN